MTSPHDIGNPGYGSSRVHPWDVVPPEPGRFDFIVDNVPGVDPMAFNREIDYQNMQQGVRNMLLEQERAARMDTQYRPADLVVSSPVAQSVVATQKQVVIAPIAKPIPVLKHKYLVIDERKPRSGDYENSIWELFMVRQVLFTAIFVLLAAMVANKSYWVLLSAFLFAFVYNSRYVVEQLEAIKNNTKPKLHLPVLATCSILTVLGGLILGGIAVTVTASLLLLVSVLCLFLGSVIISQKKFSIARKRAILQ